MTSLETTGKQCKNEGLLYKGFFSAFTKQNPNIKTTHEVIKYGALETQSLRELLTTHEILELMRN